MSIGKELGYKRYFNVQQLLLNIIGVDLSKKTVKHPYLIVVPSFAFAIIMFIVSWKNRGHTEEATATMAVVVDTIISLMKSLILVLNHKKILELIHSIWTLSKTDDVKEHAMISDLNTKAYYISNSLAAFGFFAIFMGCLVPFIETAVIYWRTGEVIFSLSSIRFDFIDSLEMWKIALLQFYTTISVIIGAACSLAIDTVFIWMVFNLTAQFRIINMRFERAATLKNQTELYCAVIESIRSHQRIIELAENFDLTYRLINFVQFAVGCLPLCFVGFQISTSSGSQSHYVAYMFIKVFSTGMYCALGQQIQDESYNVAENIYKSFNWEKLPKRTGKLLQIALTRAQKSCNLTGIFFVIDISLFVWVYKTTTSYITILWTLAANWKE